MPKINRFQRIDTEHREVCLRGPGGCVLGEAVSEEYIEGRLEVTVKLNLLGRKMFPFASLGTPECAALEHGDLKLI